MVTNMTLRLVLRVVLLQVIHSNILLFLWHAFDMTKTKNKNVFNCNQIPMAVKP